MPETISLSDIQKLQFSDKPRAEQAIQRLLEQHEKQPIAKVELNPKPESLNSVNGFVTFKDGNRFFFKAHTEENEQISEYYNASLLADNGYPVIAAKQISHSPGQQIVLYEILSYPTLFDLIKEAEDKELQREGRLGALPGGAGVQPVPKDSSTRSTYFVDSTAPRRLRTAEAQTAQTAQSLLEGEAELNKIVFSVYEKTLREISAEEHAQAPIHQLFHHRLQEDGRLGLYYRGKKLALGNDEISFEEFAQLRWIINGSEYGSTLSEIISSCQQLLKPSSGPAIVGHGDAHNGNVFVDQKGGKFYLFDPAFAGIHSPILDLTKPIFHNIFARWMYYPEQVANEFELSYKIQDNYIRIEHTFVPSASRFSFLKWKIQTLIQPTTRLLREHNMLPPNWREYLGDALFCCPFLTVNLFAKPVSNGSLAERYPLIIKLLGLSMAVEFGARPTKPRSDNALSFLIACLLEEETIK